MILKFPEIPTAGMISFLSLVYKVCGYEAGRRFSSKKVSRGRRNEIGQRRSVSSIVNSRADKYYG